MIRNVFDSSSRSFNSKNWRLKQAIDFLLDYIMEFEKEIQEGSGNSKNQDSDESFVDGGSKSESKSDRRIRLPPPDLS